MRAAASSYSAGSVPPELQRKLIFDEESGRFVSKSRMEQMKLAQELHQVAGQRVDLLDSDLVKPREEMKQEKSKTAALEERVQQLEELSPW